MSENKMNPEVKARWVAALRSGKYTQGIGTMRKNDSFCCLGVLCDLLAPDAWERRPTGQYSIEGQCALPPDTILGEAGIDTFEHVVIGGVASRLSTHNDGSTDNKSTPRRSFAEIADAIEAQL